MQSQVKIFCCLALSITVLVGPMTQAADEKWQLITKAKVEKKSVTNLSQKSVQNSSSDSTKSNKIVIEPYSSAQGEVISSYFPLLTSIGESLWGWDPKKEALTGREASPSETKPNLSNIVVGQSPTTEAQREPSNKFDELMKNLFVAFDISNTEHFRKVWFQPKEGLKFRGLWAIHDFEKKRPLVILRMGIHGNVDEFIAERFIGKILYDDLGLNVLILESLTSHAFLTSNKNISFGGIDEGLQTFFVLNEIKKSQFDNLVSSYHITALSMGGHGAFVTALLDQANHHQLKSILQLCPLINLKETFALHATQGLNQTLIDLWNTRRLKSLFDLYGDRTEVQGWWHSVLDLKPRFTNSVMKILNEERKNPLLTVADMKALVDGMKWPAGFAEHLQNSNSFDELNNFWSLYKGVKTPMMILTTPKDPLVPNEINSEKIFRGQQVGDFTSVKYHRLERGIHCGLAPVYKWDYLVKMTKEGLEL